MAGWRFLVCFVPNGKPVISVKKSFRAACEAAGLGEDVMPHILRHTAATWLMQSGTDIWQAAGFLGMTVRRWSTPMGIITPTICRKPQTRFLPHGNPTEWVEINVNMAILN